MKIMTISTLSRCFLLLLSALIFQNCTKTMTSFKAANPPMMVFVGGEEDVKVPVSYIGLPPIVLPQNDYLVKNFSAQLFKIGVPDCLDKTGGLAKEFITPVAEMVNTALSETKRFELLDKGEISELERVRLSDVLNTQRAKKDSVETRLKVLSTGATAGNAAKDIANQEITEKYFQETQNAYQIMISELKERCDGVLVLTITSIQASSLGENYRTMGIDCKIVSVETIKEADETSRSIKSNLVLYAKSHEVTMFSDEKTGSLKINREDISKIAEDIKLQFPNPNLTNNWIVTEINGRNITVNAGKIANISRGMRGFVVRMNNDKSAYKCRAEFVVNQVFPDAFNAEVLVLEELDNYILGQLKIGEPVKMK